MRRMGSPRTLCRIGLTALLVLCYSYTRPQVEVFLFVYPDCPICRYYMPLVHQMARTYPAEFCTFNYIVPAENIPLKDQRVYKRELKKKLNYRNEKILIDVNNTFAYKLKSTITPEVFVLGADGEIKYSGAIDNKYISVANYRQQADEHYLATALQGIPVLVELTSNIALAAPTAPVALMATFCATTLEIKEIHRPIKTRINLQFIFNKFMVSNITRSLLRKYLKAGKCLII